MIDTPEYHNIFPETTLGQSSFADDSGRGYIRTTEECEIVNHVGGFKTVGVGGALTGEPVDILIMDDIYKDAKTAWSPIVRENISDWYDTVAETRLHNDSRQLIVFTRWHEDDLAGKLLREQGVYDSKDNPNGWVVVVYQAIKEGAPTEYDPRQEGEPLWAERHNLEKLQAIRKRNPQVFESLYQQDPQPRAGLMYEAGFVEYLVRGIRFIVRRNLNALVRAQYRRHNIMQLRVKCFVCTLHIGLWNETARLQFGNHIVCRCKLKNFLYRHIFIVLNYHT